MTTLRNTLAALVLSAATLGAQTSAEINTNFALTRTPIGALAPMLTNTLIGRLQNGGSLALRYGNMSGGDFNNPTNAVAVTGVLPAGLGSTFNVTGGVVKSNCTGCSAGLMLGVGGDIRLAGAVMGNTSTSPTFTLSLDGELGYGKANSLSAVTGYVGAPIALVQHGSGMQFVPFITPGFMFGQLSDGNSTDNGTGLLLGGGLGIYNTLSNVTVNAGIQHSFMNGARNAIGLNVLIGGK